MGGILGGLGALQGWGHKSGPLVGYLEPDRPAGRPHGHLNFGDPGVPERVGQGLLKDPVKGDPDGQ